MSISIILPEVKEGGYRDVPDIPTNNTLIIDQYTSDAAYTPELFVEARSMKDVFYHFKPSVDVEFIDENGETILETLHFNGIQDFEVNAGEGKLVSNSLLLSSIKTHAERAENIRTNILQNAQLQAILNNEHSLNELKVLIGRLLKQVSDACDNLPIEEYPIENLLEQFGGFQAVKSFIPDIADMNPKRKVARTIFLTEPKYQKDRLALAEELRHWLEILSEEKNHYMEYADVCEKQDEKYKHLFSENITIALKATKQLETAYRTLDSFFQNTGSDKLNNLNIINVNRQVFDNEPQKCGEQVNLILGEKYNRLDLSKVYSFLVIPGYMMIDKPTLLYWAGIASKYKVLLITDHKQENSVDSLIKNIADYKGDSIELSHVVMTANWIEGRPSEKMSSSERDEKSFFIPPSAALAGKIYGQTNIAQSSEGQTFGILHKVKDVGINLSKVDIERIRESNIVPIVKATEAEEVMAFYDSTLYNGDKHPLTEYPIVRTIDWVERVLQNYYRFVNGENWDPYMTPYQIKEKIDSFFYKYRGYGGPIQQFHVELPTRTTDTNSLNIEMELTIWKYYETIRITLNSK